jgi:Icc protein
MTERVNDGLFQYGGKTEFGDWGAVFIDTHVHQAPEGRVRDEELARLDADLASFAGRPILVCLHHPPLPVRSKWLDGVGLRNKDDFLAVIDRHPSVRVVLGGHVHQEFDQMLGRVRYLTTPSTCAQFTPQTPNCVMDLKPPGYRWLHLLPDGHFDTQVRWLKDWVVTQRPPDDRF